MSDLKITNTMKRTLAAAALCGAIALPSIARAAPLSQALAPLQNDRQLTLGTSSASSSNGTSPITISYDTSTNTFEAAAVTFDLSGLPDGAQIKQTKLLLDVVGAGAGTPDPSFFNATVVSSNQYNSLLGSSNSALELLGLTLSSNSNQYGRGVLHPSDLTYSDNDQAIPLTFSLEHPAQGSGTSVQSVYDDPSENEQLTLLVNYNYNPSTSGSADVEAIEGQAGTLNSPLAGRLVVTYDVPEPASLALLGAGAGLMLVRRRRRA